MTRIIILLTTALLSLAAIACDDESGQRYERPNVRFGGNEPSYYDGYYRQR